jgi:hypothetical protein
MELRIASPCSANWDRMQGDERVRYCPECKLNVYNFDAMDSTEIESFVRNREGRLCARFYTRPDGTLLTQNCPVGFRAKVRRVSRAAGAILSAATAAMSATFAVGQTSHPVSAKSVQSKPSDAAVLLQVLDPSGAVVPKAQVSILGRESQSEFAGETDAEGRLLVQGLTLGSHSVIVVVPGFSTYRQDFEVLGSQTLKLTATVRLGIMGEVIDVRHQSFFHKLKSLL